MILDLNEYLDEALKDTKVCPLIIVDIQADPVISREYYIQKSIKQLLKARFICPKPKEELTIKILNNISKEENK